MSERGAAGPIRVVFCGTPEFAVPALRALDGDPAFDVALVVTQPDRPSGRGRRVAMPPVGIAAGELGIPVHQPDRLRTEAEREPLVAADADVFIVAAYGVIFGARTLAIPRHGCLNLHASILPAYRGASPISAAIVERAPRTGVTLMRMERGLDTGPKLAVRTTDIRPDDTTASLTARLAEVGATLAVETIPGVVAGDIVAVDQGEPATLTRPLTKADGWLDWTRTAPELNAHVRAMWPWPRAWTTVGDPATGGFTMQVHRSSFMEGDGMPDRLPGTIVAMNGYPAVATGSGWLRLDVVQEPGGRPVSGSVLLNSSRLTVGSRLGLTGAPADLRPLIMPVDG